MTSVRPTVTITFTSPPLRAARVFFVDTQRDLGNLELRCQTPKPEDVP